MQDKKVEGVFRVWKGRLLGTDEQVLDTTVVNAKKQKKNGW